MTTATAPKNQREQIVERLLNMPEAVADAMLTATANEQRDAENILLRRALEQLTAQREAEQRRSRVFTFATYGLLMVAASALGIMLENKLAAAVEETGE